MLCVLVLLHSLRRSDCASTTKPGLVQKLSKAHFEFSLELYRELVRQGEAREDDDGGGGVGGGVGGVGGAGGGHSGNLVCSPYSVYSVLSMLFLGTSSLSESSRQLRAALHFNDVSYVDAHTAFGEVSRSFAEDRYYERKVRSANALFAQEGTEVSPHYARALLEFYRARVEALDFRNADPAQTVGVVNDWVSDVTDGAIPRLLDSPPAGDTRLLIVNALSMDAKWLHPFDPNETFDKGLFFLPGGQR